MRARILGLVILVMLVSATQAAAQSGGTVREGSRVRLEAASVSARPVTGTVVAFNETTLKMRSDLGSLVVVPREAISRLDVRTARHSNWKKGLAIGAAVGLVAGLTTTPSCSGKEFFCIEFDPLLVGLAGSVVVGSVGALVGALARTDTWAPVVSSPRLTLAPARKGGVVLLALPF